MCPVTRFAGSNPADDNGCSKAIKIRNAPSFGGEGKPLAACRNILRHVEEPLEV
jgi:hypothetical protein